MWRVAASAIVSAIFTAVAVSAFWIWFYNFVPSAAAARNGRIEASGDVATARPGGGPAVAFAEGLEVGPAGLALPVVGIKPDQLVDTYDAARGTGRRHDAIDIMAPEGAAVIAAANGTIEKLFNSVRGGLTVYERSDDQRWIYYYAHLSAYAPGLAEGQRVKQGQIIARVGHTGDASAAGPHLHFAINQMAPGERWWTGTPINPYPLLAGKKASG
jgi:murein DD-endopeptidase MepM/ murein hydrolase activator NlpD